MTELHSGLKLFRGQLRDAVARDLGRAQRSRAQRSRAPARLALRVGLPATVAAAATALLLSLTVSSPLPAADAAIMRHVVAALTAPPGTILHERALVTLGSATQPYELWVETGGTHAYRVIKWGHEGTGTSGALVDPAATLRSMVQSGQAHVDATTTFDGAPAYKLTVTGAPDRWLNGTVYVSRADYHPLLIDTNGEQIAVQTYEYLPATPANMALLQR
jgi:hypothetical protein